MPKLPPESLQKLIAFRRELHQYPELSLQEKETAARICTFQEGFAANKVLTNLGGTGVACVYEGKEAGPTTLFRAELDALPITELNDIPHGTRKPGISHKCGHDGHMSILLGLGMHLHQNPPNRGNVVLMFQPGEEIGAGARLVVNDAAFPSLKVDRAFALHNLPGYELGTVVYKDGVFNAASQGLIAKFRGYTSHAAEPEKGLSPGNLMASLMKELSSMSRGTLMDETFRLITLVFAQLGERNFGISPGRGEVRATLRTGNDEQMKELSTEVVNFIQREAEAMGLSEQILWEDVFPASKNHKDCVEVLAGVVKDLNLPSIEMKHPMSWSEDFGHFTQKVPGAMFGLGAGKKHPELHSEYYDFPDELIPIGVDIFTSIVGKYNS